MQNQNKEEQLYNIDQNDELISSSNENFTS